MLKKIKYNKYFLLSIILMLVIICISFIQFYHENFSYVNDYNKIKEYCYEKKDIKNEYCKTFKNRENLEWYINSANPQKRYETYNAITLTCTIIETTFFRTLQYFSPLIIALAVLGTIHTQFSSGMFENYLLRKKYKDYLKDNYKIVLKSALIMPITLIIIFAISSILSGFNFNLNNVDNTLSVYSKWKYENFIIYSIIICLIQFFISLLYANISLCCLKQNRNKIVAIVMSYVGFIIVNIFIYVILYAVFLKKILGLKELTDYFNIAGYWFFNGDSNPIISLIIAFLLQIISFIVVAKKFKNKEKLVLAYEKQVS